MTEVIHDSQSLTYRNPFGAAVCGSEITLSIFCSEPWQAVTLRLWQDGGEMLVPMERTQPGWFVGKITARVPGLIWYYFILRCDGKVSYYGNNPEHLGGIGSLTDETPASYQLTVYQPQMIPRWYRQGVMYQIFVDRFYYGGEERLPAPPGALIHAHWDDAPVYTKDVQTGEILAYDFFGGNLAGIREKLPYLKDLGVTILYLNPIFESISNHKYDTGDYRKIDPMFGTNEEFTELCREAEALGIFIILDGVFSHTGSDSVYFNRYGRYDSIGAYQSKESPYYSWYRFEDYPERYQSWWGIDTLPNVEETDPAYQKFMVSDDDSVVKYWLKAGAKGWRLDVVDELPDDFVQKLCRAVKETDAEAVVIGEVWEDASHKESYGELRPYLLGAELDSTMNYPFRRIVLDFILGRQSTELTHRQIMSLYENYPKDHFFSAMNLIDSHDVPRALSLLGDETYTGEETIVALNRRRLSKMQQRKAVDRLKMLVVWQMTFPGVPCIYYGDEAGLEGYRDPLNRRTYPWGRENKELLAWYRKIVALRHSHDVFINGDFVSFAADEEVYGYLRRTADEQALVLLSRSDQWLSITVASDWAKGRLPVDLLYQEPVLKATDGRLIITLRPFEGKVLYSTCDGKHENVPSRGAGVLLHPSSLPTADFLGGLGPEAYAFVDFLVQAGQTYWQMLPLNPVGFGESPYQCPSAFAGNPYFIDLAELSGAPVDYAEQPADPRLARCWKEDKLRRIYQREGEASRPEIEKFRKQNRFWLPDYALFTALSASYGSPWSSWPEELCRRDPVALDQAKTELKEEVFYQEFLQYHFFRQWQELKRYAGRQKIELIGDMPLYVAYDSADVWSRPELFDLDENLAPRRVAGVPPDYFSEDGQLWGNPLYRWENHAAEQYGWWRQRVSILLNLVDWIRLDHFRGLAAYFAVDAAEKTARQGVWLAGPGEALLRFLQQDHDPLPFIAEDLGYITGDVIDLKEKFDLSGMQVLQFGFYATEAGCARLSIPPRTVVYTGTHDNNTTAGWYHDSVVTTELESFVRHYVGEVTTETIAVKLVELAYASAAGTVVIPVQDLLGMGAEERMNTPGTVGGNWHFRLPMGTLTAALAERLYRLAIKYDRLPTKNNRIIR